MTKQTSNKNPFVVMRPAVAETIRSIAPGQSVTFACGDLASYPSACGRVSQLNSSAGRQIYTIVSTDNGATYTISRKQEEV